MSLPSDTGFTKVSVCRGAAPNASFLLRNIIQISPIVRVRIATTAIMLPAITGVLLLDFDEGSGGGVTFDASFATDEVGTDDVREESSDRSVGLLSNTFVPTTHFPSPLSQQVELFAPQQ